MGWLIEKRLLENREENSMVFADFPGMSNNS